MRLIYEKIGLEYEFCENRVFIIDIEKPEAMREFMAQLWNQVGGATGEIILSQNEKELVISKNILMIMNPFNLDCNEKRLLNKLYTETVQILNENYSEQVQKVNEQVVNLIDTASEKIPYSTTFEVDLNLADLLKIYGFKLDIEAGNLLENIVNYIMVMHRICGFYICVFNNLKQYFESEDLKKLYEFSFYEKVFLIDVENNDKCRIPGEYYWILDKDFCIIN